PDGSMRMWTAPSDPVPSSHTLVLRPGDAMYMPSGTRHSAETRSLPSVHIAIGIRLTTWATVLKSVVGKLVDSVGATEVLPAGYARATDGELLQRLRSYFHLVVERFHQTPDGALEEYLAGCF